MVDWRQLSEPPTVIGYKASRLGMLARAGLPVPPGVVGIGPADVGPIAVPEIGGALPRQLMAVRSSSLAEDLPRSSLAGAHLTRLFVSPEEFDRAFDEVRASGPDAMPVLVQPMVDAVCSGVVYTRSPTSSDYWVVEAAPGAGSVVRGVGWATIRYLRSARVEGPLEIHDLRGTRPEWAANLEANVIDAEAVLGFAGTCVEFAVDRGGRSWILQARPLPPMLHRVDTKRLAR
jgi:hypothetical protein